MGVVFFFKQKTAYEMRISDWSSDVCSSDLVQHAAVLGAGIMGGGISYQSASKGVPVIMKDIADKALDLGMEEANKLLSKKVGKKLTAEKAGHILRAEERRVVIECISTCRFRWSPDQEIHHQRTI